MPIYAYKCENCGHQQDVLQKISDPVLTICPACGTANFKKQLTAAGFQLKGSGWYVTDFRDNKSASPGKKEAAATHHDTSEKAAPASDSSAASAAPASSTPTNSSAASVNTAATTAASSPVSK